MKGKDGNWIAVLAANLEVSRVDVRGSEMLDLVEVTIGTRQPQASPLELPRQTLYFDRTEAAELSKALLAAVNKLGQDLSVRVELEFAATVAERQIWVLKYVDAAGLVMDSAGAAMQWASEAAARNYAARRGWVVVGGADHPQASLEGA